MNSYLTDSAILVYLLRDDPIPPKVSAVLLDETATVFYSPLNVAEIGIKFAKNKLALSAKVSVDLLGAVRRVAHDLRMVELPLAQQHAVRLAYLPRIHNDPFDRLLISQAIVEDLTLISPDSVFPRYTDLKLLRF